ncbi:MAG: rhodanese-like domain-containing protein [Pseudomonadota bacterium]
MKLSTTLAILSFGAMITLHQPVLGEELQVKLTPEINTLEVKHQGKSIEVKRNQDQTHTLDDAWAKTSRKCPPFCPQPYHVAEGVTTVGEVEVFQFMRDKVNSGTGLLIDARLPSWHEKGTIPGSINIPFTEFERKPSDPALNGPMKKISAKRRGQVGFVEHTWDKTLKTAGISTQRSGFWDYSESPDLMFWCNGPWCGQSPHAIKGLLELGFPPEKLYYYRGGMQMWELMGLTTVVPEAE